MKKKAVSKPKSVKAARSPKPPAKPAMNRREMLVQMRDYGAIAAVLGAGGWWLAWDVQAHRRTHDLSRIGQGAATVVQVHDPSCPLCAGLQRETLAALDAFQDGAIDYVVADITTSAGAAFAREHGVSHVTLMLFDGDGALLQVLSGARSRSALVAAFERQFRAPRV